MSQDGRVVVKVQAPVLGSVIGAQLLKDIMARKQSTMKEEPAVVTKPPNGEKKS